MSDYAIQYKWVKFLKVLDDRTCEHYMWDFLAFPANGAEFAYHHQDLMCSMVASLLAKCDDSAVVDIIWDFETPPYDIIMTEINANIDQINNLTNLNRQLRNTLDGFIPEDSEYYNRMNLGGVTHTEEDRA